ncbi:nickel pincer cofactor biosynthesis protein LarB [candidate division WOR-3 bacterium]|nr:nickel pincer cofactor biosynthesis protein LarB [candidate division WOR-3 bacterium]
MKKEKVFIDPFDDLGYAKVDLHREKRKGFPEVVFSEGKTKKQILSIAARILKSNNKVLLTRVLPKVANVLKSKYKKGKYYKDACIFYIGTKPKQSGLICILTGGTADIPVAEEAAVTAEIMGSKVKKIYDVGVAGIHRILSFRKEIEKVRVLVVVAGMDGVLASVAGGLFAKPIIAVPTSVGYGLSLKGITPLLTMLNSCAPGVAVVNIDNGFGAGYIAAIINRL